MEWSVKINLTAGDNEVSVAVKDKTGEITEDVAKSTISYVEVPSAFDLDTMNGRLVDRSYTLTSSGEVSHLVQHNYLTGEQEVFDWPPGSPTGGCFRAAENQYVYVNARPAGVRELRRYDFNTRRSRNRRSRHHLEVMGAEKIRARAERFLMDPRLREVTPPMGEFAAGIGSGERAID